MRRGRAVDFSRDQEVEEVEKKGKDTVGRRRRRERCLPDRCGVIEGKTWRRSFTRSVRRISNWRRWTLAVVSWRNAREVEDEEEDEEDGRGGEEEEETTSRHRRLSRARAGIASGGAARIASRNRSRNGHGGRRRTRRTRRK